MRKIDAGEGEDVLVSAIWRKIVSFEKFPRFTCGGVRDRWLKISQLTAPSHQHRLTLYTKKSFVYGLTFRLKCAFKMKINLIMVLNSGIIDIHKNTGTSKKSERGKAETMKQQQLNENILSLGI